MGFKLKYNRLLLFVLVTFNKAFPNTGLVTAEPLLLGKIQGKYRVGFLLLIHTNLRCVRRDAQFSLLFTYPQTTVRVQEALFGSYKYILASRQIHKKWNL